MQLTLPQQLSVKQISRWMGFPASAEVDEQTLQLAQKAGEIVLSSAQPRGIYRIGELEMLQNGELMCANIPLIGTDIAHHLQKCNRAVWMAVTIGTRTEMQTRRLGKDMALVCAVDAAAGLLAETLADQLQEQIRQEVDSLFYMTGRYSPGYGDFPIGTQRQVIDFLDAPRKIGLTVNSGGILIPRKSITAVCGLSDQPVKGHLAGCAHCILRTKCNYRKEGKYCGNSELAE